MEEFKNYTSDPEELEQNNEQEQNGGQDQEQTDGVYADGKGDK